MEALIKALGNSGDSSDEPVPAPSGDDDLSQHILERAMKTFRRARESGDEELAKEALESALSLLED